MLEFIIYGLIHEGDWDLTQPQAVLIAAFASGIFLVSAAWIAFHGQQQARTDERRRHADQLRIQREGWAADSKAASDRAYRNEVRETYRAVLRASRAVHLPTLDFHQAKQKADGEITADVERHRDKIKSELAELMVLSSELILVQTQEVEDAFQALTDQILTNGAMTAPVAIDAPPSEDFDFLQAERLLNFLAAAMGRHLHDLRPAVGSDNEDLVAE